MPPPPARAFRARAAAAPVFAALLASLAGCGGTRGAEVSAAAVQRDRAARADLSKAIAEDHHSLADLIASDRFADTEAIYRDRELREIALRLIERTRALGDLSNTDVLAPGAP